MVKNYTTKDIDDGFQHSHWHTRYGTQHLKIDDQREEAEEDPQVKQFGNRVRYENGFFIFPPIVTNDRANGEGLRTIPETYVRLSLKRDNNKIRTRIYTKTPEPISWGYYPIIHSNSNNFRSEYNLYEREPCFGGYSGQLSIPDLPIAVWLMTFQSWLLQRNEDDMAGRANLNIALRKLEDPIFMVWAEGKLEDVTNRYYEKFPLE